MHDRTRALVIVSPPRTSPLNKIEEILLDALRPFARISPELTVGVADHGLLTSLDVTECVVLTFQRVFDTHTITDNRSLELLGLD